MCRTTGLFQYLAKILSVFAPQMFYLPERKRAKVHKSKTVQRRVFCIFCQNAIQISVREKPFFLSILYKKRYIYTCPQQDPCPILPALASRLVVLRHISCSLLSLYVLRVWHQYLTWKQTDCSRHTHVNWYWVIVTKANQLNIFGRPQKAGYVPSGKFSY